VQSKLTLLCETDDIRKLQSKLISIRRFTRQPLYRIASHFVWVYYVYAVRYGVAYNWIIPKLERKGRTPLTSSQVDSRKPNTNETKHGGLINARLTLRT
jgi:hypothetical protein